MMQFGLGEQLNDSMGVPVLMFVHCPEGISKVWILRGSEPVGALGHPPTSHIVTQIVMTHNERVTTVERMARTVTRDVVTNAPVAGVTTECGEPSLHSSNREQSNEREKKRIHDERGLPCGRSQPMAVF